MFRKILIHLNIEKANYHTGDGWFLDWTKHTNWELIKILLNIN